MSLRAHHESAGSLTARLIRRALLIALALPALALVQAVEPAFAASGSCPKAPRYRWQGNDIERQVKIATPNGSDVGEVFRPANAATYPGHRPGVLIMHGLGGSQCDVWWAARALAGHGYSVLTFTEHQFTLMPYYSDAQSALRFLAGSRNPFAAYTDPHRLAAAGHSEGSIEAALLQADPANDISAIVAFDNLHRYAEGDPGGAVFCPPAVPSSDPITPRVPALGEAEDAACTTSQNDTEPNVKETGWSWWRSARQPTMLVDIAGATHLDWADPDGGTSPHLLRIFAYYAQAWLDRYLANVSGAQTRLLDPTVLGEPLAQVLSSHYLSGAFLPGVIDTHNLARAKLPTRVSTRSPRKSPVDVRRGGRDPTELIRVEGLVD